MRTCSLGKSICHTQAECRDYSPGFCCQCYPSYYGNGETCLAVGKAIRIHGKVNGRINSVSIDNQDLHCYVVTDQGRTYTAISK